MPSSVKQSQQSHNSMNLLHIQRKALHLLIYAALLFWTLVSLFPIFWTLTTSFKNPVDVLKGHILPWLNFEPSWRGWRTLGLSPDTIFANSTVRGEFLNRFSGSVIATFGGALVAVTIGSLAAYGLSRFQYKFGPMRNKDISFFFLSTTILPPVVLALPFLVLYKHLELLDTHIGLILVYALTVLPLVIWIMRTQFDSIPIELDEAAQVDGCTSWSAFVRIMLPISLPGIAAAFILSSVLCWNEYFFAALLTSTYSKTLPVMLASQTSSQSINWWTMAALGTAAIAPLVLVGVFLENFIVKGLTAGAVK